MFFCSKCLMEYRMIFIIASLTNSAGINWVDMFFNNDSFRNDVNFFSIPFPYFDKFYTVSANRFFFGNIMRDGNSFKIIGNLFPATLTAFVCFYVSEFSSNTSLSSSLVNNSASGKASSRPSNKESRSNDFSE